MTAVLKVMHRNLVVEFYKQNAAFFGFVLLVFFGFIRGNEHLAIGHFIVNNPATIFFLFIIWVMYSAKVVLFLIPTINKPENQFLEVFILLDKKTRIVTVLTSAFILLLPVIFYSGFVISLALTSKSTNSIISLLVILSLLIASLSTFIRLKLMMKLMKSMKK